MNRLYVTDRAEDGGIFRFDLIDGAPVLRGKTDLPLPTYAVFRDNVAYVLLRGGQGTDQNGWLVQASLLSDGNFGAFSEPISTHGQVPCHLCVVGGEVYVVNYVSGNLVKLPDTIVTHHGHGTHPTRQEAAHTHFVTASPDERYILCTDLGLDTIFVYDRDLTPVSSATVPVGSGCRHLIFSPDGRFLYCVNELTSDVSVLSYRDGALTYLRTYPAFDRPCPASTAAAIRFCDGHLYLSHRGMDCISRYAADGERLTLLDNTPCGGHSPRDFDILDGMLYCANEDGHLGILDLTGAAPRLCESRALGHRLLGINFRRG